MQTSDNIKAISAALLKVQADVHGVAKNATNPHFKNRYATLEAVIEAAKPALQAAGLVFMQAPGRLTEFGLEVSTRIIHPDSGEWVQSTLGVPLAKHDPQGAGSAITYACRYSLMAMLGLPPVDDDAEAAVGRGPSNSAPAAPQRPAAAKSGDAEQYVSSAIKALRVAKTKKDLLNWWAAEKPNRDKFQLDPTKGPGRQLMDAYTDHADSLNPENMMMAG